ncbi:imidazolonepropionase [Longispora albida]|uniref:imidazolonepropionase n=1 Tax=Longispora albida TaxID=203523 RepID=UPI0003753EBE|nr:imidazolonepropionase [Longispora albida]
MSSTLITNIGELFGAEGDALVIDGDRIAWIGTGSQPADNHYDAGGRAVLPGWVDSHSHLVFAGDRTAEFTARMAGQAYAAGGISVTVNATRSASDADLQAGLGRHVAEMLANGTTCIETKTGYGLSTVDETRSARIAASSPSVDEVTFLGAHLVPPGADADEYVKLVAGEMLDAVAPYAGWADVFCERGAFDYDQSRTVLEAAAARGLGLRVHGNQLGHGPGVRLACELGAASVDHCTYLTPEDIGMLASTGTVATLLPATDLSTRQPLPDARALLDAGATVALASNCNPGSSYTSSMAYVVATAVLQMRMTVEEAVTAATLGGARALRRTDVGVLRPGARADLHILEAPSATWLAYRPGMPLTHAVWHKGTRVR